MFRRICALVVVLFLAFSLVAFAADAPAATTKDQNAGTKLARGFVNLVGFWLELPKQIYLTSKQDNLFVGLTYGFVKGIGVGFYRLADGIFETVTFVIPPYDKIIVEPEYVFEGWN
ncbi:MAG: exosortase system-associated protein, TIGR04073 family [Candidatus Omnitrophota bacterium]